MIAIFIKFIHRKIYIYFSVHIQMRLQCRSRFFIYFIYFLKIFLKQKGSSLSPLATLGLWWAPTRDEGGNPELPGAPRSSVSASSFLSKNALVLA